MREQPHYDDLLTEAFFREYYVEKRMSYPQIREMLRGQGHNIHVGTLHKYAKKHHIGRNSSEARRNLDPEPLDFNISFLTESMIETVDGFLLGDGRLSVYKTDMVKSGRASCGLQYEEFCNFMMAGFSVYRPTCRSYAREDMSLGVIWDGCTKAHPDFYVQHQRWYKAKNESGFTKIIPQDVRITPKSVMLWYLGDGSLVNSKETVTIRLSTDGFAKEEVEFLASKLNECGIDCHRNKENRIRINTKGIPSFFDFIGHEIPIKCYDYKFEMPEWRFEAIRMSEVVELLNCDYQSLAYLVKIGTIPVYRASEKGRPRFLPEHIEIARKLMKQGVLH